MNKALSHISCILSVFFLSLHGVPPPPPPGWKPPTQPIAPAPSTQNPVDNNQNNGMPAFVSQPAFINKGVLNNPAVSTNSKVIAIQGQYTTLNGAPQKITPKNKYQPTQVATAVSKAGVMSFTQLHQEAKTTGQLFGDNQAIATAYENFMSALQTVPSFIPLFRKMHIIALHQIYLHLIGIYTTLNMTYISDLKTYITLEKKYGLNKKTLIINHLVNIIQAQLSQAIQTLFPGFPQSHAIKAGMATLEHDHASNPDIFILDLEKSVLAVLKAAPLSDTQAGQVYAALTDPSNTSLLAQNKDINNADLSAGLSIIKAEGGGFVTPLIQNKIAATAVVEALDTLVAHYTRGQSNANYQAIIGQLKAGAGNSLTTQQFSIFTKTVQQFAYGIPLTEEIQYSEQLKQLLDTKSIQVLTTQQLDTIKGIIGFILQNYEQNSAKMVSSIVNALGQKNPEAETLSVSQKIEMKSLASQLLLPTDQHPLALGAVQDESRFTLSYALHVLSNQNKNLSSDDKTALASLAEELNKMPLEWQELTPSQATALRNALTILASYTFKPETETSIEATFTPAQQTQLSQLAKQITSDSFTTFDIFSKDEQILLLQMYQNLNAIIETRLQVHKEEGKILYNVFDNDQAIQNALFASLTMSQYLALTNLDKTLSTTPEGFSFAQVSSVPPPADPGEAANISEYDALKSMFFVPTSSSDGETFLSLLYKLRNQHFNDAKLISIIQAMPQEEHALYISMLEQINKQGFTFSQLSQDQRDLLIKDFQELLDQSSSDPVEKNDGPALLDNPEEDLLETVSDVIHYTMQYNQMKSSFLWVLKHYLNFFSVYTATLQEYSDKGYAGLTKFSTYAQGVIEQLKNTPIETLNPPLFFYDAATMRGVKLLPQLAQLVEQTEIVPYPTFSMTLALEGSTQDPLDGKTYTNKVTLGSGVNAFSYNKFFFIDTTQDSGNVVTDPNGDVQAYQPAKELTGTEAQNISWIKKQTVPTSGKSMSYMVPGSDGNEQTVTVKPYDYVYLPNNIPSGLSGFYMNIPTFTQNPLNKDQALVRLFEQPIYAQPTWLNYPGFSATAPDAIPGVITMLRGCLGDFKSILDLNIFDPCLTMIFKAALAIPDTPDSKSITLQQELTQDPQIQDLSDRCSAFIDAKQAEVQRMQETHTVDTNVAESILSGASAGGTIGIPQGAQ